MASMALMPVCSGCFTGWRSTMPGAGDSTGRRRVVRIGPLPSTGLPSGSTTAADHLGSDGHRQQLAGGADFHAFGDFQIVAKDNDGDGVLFEIEGEALDVALGEVDEFAGHDPRRGRSSERCRRRLPETRPVSRTSSLSPMSAICRSMMDVISLALSFNDIAAYGLLVDCGRASRRGPHGGIVDLCRRPERPARRATRGSVRSSRIGSL